MIALFTQKTLYYEETFHYLYILDACGNGLFVVKKIKSNVEKWCIDRLFVRLVSSEKPCEKLGYFIWKHIYFLV